MKKFNGTDYDNLLPLAYNALDSNLLNGKSYQEIVEIVGTGGENCRIAYGSYVGNGLSGERFPNSIECGFCPLLMMVSEQSDTQHWALRGVNGFYWGNNRRNVILWGGSAVSWYYPQTDQYFPPAGIQMNTAKTTYHYLVLGYSTVGEQGNIFPDRKEWTVTSNMTWTVPYTGNYFVELYGGGGYGDIKTYWVNDVNYVAFAEGGSSCQRYESLHLTKNSKMVITIGIGASKMRGASVATNATGTSFRTYSVAGGGNGQVSVNNTTNIQAIGGAGAGNKGTTRKANSKGTIGSTYSINYSNGIYAKQFGYSNNSNSQQARNGAVYIKYLGA